MTTGKTYRSMGFVARALRGAGGTGQNPSRRKPQKLLQKTSVIIEGSIFSYNFSKIKLKIKIQFFYRIFIETFKMF